MRDFILRIGIKIVEVGCYEQLRKNPKTSITYDKGRLDYKSVKWNDKKLTRSTTFNHAKAFRPKAIYLWNTWSATMTCKIYLPRFPTFLLDHRSPLLHNGAEAIIKSYLF